MDGHCLLEHLGPLGGEGRSSWVPSRVGASVFLSAPLFGWGLALLHALTVSACGLLRAGLYMCWVFMEIGSLE